MTDTDLLDQVLDTPSQPFALLHRPTTAPGIIEVLTGEVSLPATLADIPLPPDPHPGAHHEVLVLVPYRQLAERGFACTDDATPLVAMTVTDQQRLPLDEALGRIPDTPTTLADGGFDIDDDTYEEAVRRIVKEMIGTGEGANFVIKRTFVADITDYGPRSAPALFRRLLKNESGAHWTFLIHTGTRTLVGASPERHVSLQSGTAVMNPISGTYRYPLSGPSLTGVLEFLGDRKETDELYMVLDEELKMMARICPAGGRVMGPYLKEMAKVAHTEYFIEGRTSRDVRDILRETLFAPTVTGSPLESACRTIAQFEPAGRAYYSGVAALIGRDNTGERVMDSAILIRTADIAADGHLAIGVGATIVRHSHPASEAAETRAKAAALVTALDQGRQGRFADHPGVRQALGLRNDTIAGFWLSDTTARESAWPHLAGRDVLVVDAEDTFTAMLDQQLRALGLRVTIRRFDQDYTFDRHDLVVMGPGPGDPQDTGHPKMRHLHTAISTLLHARQPFLAVCLSHQILGLTLGLPLHRRTVPNQGMQKEIDLFGTPERVGFYNTYALLAQDEEFTADGLGPVQVSRDPATGEVHALRAPWFASMQFHPESVLTQKGPHIVATTLTGLLTPGPRPKAPGRSPAPRPGAAAPL